MVSGERVTLLAGGGTVYLYAPDDKNIGAMRAVLDVAYPADDVVQRTMPVASWETVLPILERQGIEVVDVRNPEVVCCGKCGMALTRVVVDGVADWTARDGTACGADVMYDGAGDPLIGHHEPAVAQAADRKVADHE